MYFHDRTEAGQKLAKTLTSFSGKENTIVIALPRGGVVIGYEVAKLLHRPLDIICSKKIGAPSNPEFAIGAITDSGKTIWNAEAIAQLNLTKEYLAESVKIQKQKALDQLFRFRGTKPRNLADKTVILVDDGLATGSTMLAAIETAQEEKAKAIIVALPVAAKESLAQVEELVDGTICLYTPPTFFAVGQFYTDFAQVEDEEVIALLKKAT